MDTSTDGGLLKEPQFNFLCLQLSESYYND